MANFTTVNPIAVGDATKKQDMDVLADNNTRLLDFFKVQHKFHGAGIRGGRHFGLAKYAGNGTAIANAAETNIFSQADVDFAAGAWEAVVLLDFFVGVWRFAAGVYSSFTEYTTGANALRPEVAGHYLPGDGGTISKYATISPAFLYIKLDWAFGTNTLTLAVKPDAFNRPWAYAIWRID